jgi:hypothetical protein
VGSGVVALADKCWPDVWREEGWKDLALAARAAFGSRGTAVAVV